MKSNELTIAIVDTAFYPLATRSIETTLAITNAKRVLVMSDRDFFPGSEFVKIDPINDKRDYSRLMLKELGRHITTDRFMVIQYDGIPIDRDLWQDDFMKYDYIGATWPWGPADQRVGNGGFSIRSRRIHELCLQDEMEFDPPGYGDNNYMEDTHICRLYRGWLESQGMLYAPPALANQFSAEFPGGRFPTYGFHGTLCLPHYLSDDHMKFYIENLSDKFFMDVTQTRIVFGLFLAERWDLMEMMMDRGMTLDPDFPQRLFDLFSRESALWPGMTLHDLEQVLINY